MKHSRCSAMTKERKTAAGFTLLEVMIAVAIIALALVTVMGSQSQSVDIAAEARFDTDAALLARQKLTELMVEAENELISEQGDFGEAYPAWTWKTEVAELSEEEAGVTGAEELLVMVDLTVSLKEGEGRDFTLRRIVYLPEKGL